MIQEQAFNREEYLKKELLRFTTAGSVDDGKSTLIGRLLYDSKSIYEDQYEAIRASSEQRGEDYVNLALLTDGLRSEREQGITIDVAYRYFSTPKRKFIIADTPGHIQYTRNMVTGASTAHLAIILVDARKGLVEQTRRHAFIASLLQIPHLVVCINKMDLVGFQQKVFDDIVEQFKEFSTRLAVKDVRFIPISALLGDNVVDRSENMPWYNGASLLYMLETIHIAGDENHIDCRFPVQYVIRPQSVAFPDYRGYAGRVAGGVFKIGDEVMALPSGFTSKIIGIDLADQPIQEAFAPMSVTLRLADEIDISRGDMIVKPQNSPQISQDLELMICWMNETPLSTAKKYLLRHTTQEVRCLVKEIRYKMDIENLHQKTDDLEIGLNEIAKIRIRTTAPIFFDSYRRNRHTGSVILVDESTFETVAAGMLVP